MTPHPCMTDFLQAYKANPEVRGYYNGNHIVGSLTTDPGKWFLFNQDSTVKAMYIPIEDWGYDHLCSLFDQMTEWKKEILKDYFKRYENKN